MVSGYRWLWSSLLVVIGVLCTTEGYGQGQSVISLEEQTAKQIITTIERQSPYRFSYLEAALPSGTYSLEIDLAAIDIDLLAEVLGRSIVATDTYQLVIAKRKTSTIEQYWLVEGQVTESSTQTPIIGAAIQIGGGSGTVSDVSGDYRLEGVYLSSTPVSVSYLGYSTLETTIGQLAKTADIQLAPRGHILDDIVIRSQRRTMTSQLLGETIRPEDMQLPSAPDKDVFSLAQVVPGVYNSSESLTDLQIRGGTPDQVLYSWGGIRLFQNSLFYGRVSAVNPFMIDQVNITRNGASADEHASASGAINMEADLTQIDTTQVRLHLNGLYANVGVETAQLDGRLQMRAAYRRSLTDVYQSPIYDNYFENSFQFGRLADIDYFLDSFDIAQFNTLTPTFSFEDRSASIQYAIDSSSYVRASYLGYGNLFTYQITNDFSSATGIDSFQMESTGSSIEWHQQWSGRLSTDASYSQSGYRYYYFNTEDIEYSAVGTFEQENNVEQQALQVSTAYTHPLYELTVGYHRLSWQAGYRAFSNRPFEAFVNDEKEVSSHENSLFANVEIHTKPWYTLMLGVRRSDYNLSLLHRKIWEPRLHASLMVSDRWTVHGHYGRFHQNLNRRNFGTPLDVDNGFWLLSDERPASENFVYIVQSEQGSLGVKYSGDTWSAGLDVYQKYTSDVWTSAFDFDSSEDRYEFADLNIRGLELYGQYRSGPYSLMVTYDYVRDYLTTTFSGTTMPSPFSQPHRLMVAPAANMGRWVVSAQWSLATGRAYSLPRALVQFVNEDGNLENVLEYDDFLTETVANYSRVDIGLRYRVRETASSKVDVSLQFMNVLGRDNIIKEQYYINYYQEPRVAAFEHRGLPRMWDFAVDVTF